MTSYSKPSNFVYSLNIPKAQNISAEFTYNFYVSDESINPDSKIPDILKTSSPDQINSKTTRFSLRVPRFVTVSWTPPPNNGYIDHEPIEENINKISSEENFVSSKYIPYNFSGTEKIEDAYNDANNNGNIATGKSQASVIDDYVSGLLGESFPVVGDSSDEKELLTKISTAIESIETFLDNPKNSLGLSYQEKGKLISDNSGFSKLVDNADIFHSQISALIVNDVFLSSSLRSEDRKLINDFRNNYVQNGPSVGEAVVTPISIGSYISDHTNPTTTTDLIGYIVDKYELVGTGYLKVNSFYFDNITISSFTDTSVKYGALYYYVVKTVARIVTPGFDEINSTSQEITHYVSSKTSTASIHCIEKSPPPPPDEVNFVWNYNTNKLNLVWSMPFNMQRDIKQFQIFRRSSINEPFELIKMYCFDQSSKKYITGEKIDGNKIGMTDEEMSYVSYMDYPTMSYLDEDFKTDIENLKTSKFIYAISSVDAHGMLSGYSTQFEVYFDFFKNRIIKKLISISGAPRPYPNMYLNIDAFKDTIKTSGSQSTKLKVYFMPEYFKVRYDDGNIQKMVSTVQDNSYYKIQIINLDNQKSDYLKISVDDPNGLTN